MTKKNAKPPLLVDRIENVSKEVFDNYYEEITDLVADSPGVYALYSGDELYYVGKSIELRKRVKQHLKDRHLASWTHFSLYLTRKVEHIHEIESLLVRIANPKGNRVIPQSSAAAPMVKRLKALIQQKQKQELASLFVQKKAGQKRDVRHVTGRPQSLVGLVSKPTKIYREYKGNEYWATLSPKGIITLNGKRYTTPTGAAKAVVDRGAVNGWYFWYIENVKGEWVWLARFRM